MFPYLWGSLSSVLLVTVWYCCFISIGQYLEAMETFTEAPRHKKQKDLCSWVAPQLEPYKRLATTQVLPQSKAPEYHHWRDVASSLLFPILLPASRYLSIGSVLSTYSMQRLIPLAEPCLTKQRSGCQLSLLAASETRENPLMPLGARKSITPRSQNFTKIHV